MVMVSKCGLMEQGMRDSGYTTRHRVEESFGMLMETLTKESGMMIRPTVLVFTLTPMEQNTKVTGKMIYNMVMERKPGLMDPVMREITTRERSMEVETINGLMEASTMENGWTIK
jgi:hypothetical protein